MAAGKLAGKLDVRLERLKLLRAAAPDAASAAKLEPELEKALRDRSNLIVAEAAKLIALHKRIALVPNLIAAFERLLDDPVKTDPKCWGKTAIIKALVDLDYSESPPFLRALQHIQMEPVWGGQEDAALALRANAALALVPCIDLSRPEKLRRLVDALADPADPVRVEAVRALGQMDGEEAILVLRLKAHTGDRRPHVAGQVFDTLLQLEGARAVAFVASFMTVQPTREEIRDEAALALGGSRLPAAVTALLNAWQAARATEFRATLLRALSASRDDTALEFLLGLVREGTGRDAAAAHDALALHKDSPEIQQRLAAARNSG